jgi:ferritin
MPAHEGDDAMLNPKVEAALNRQIHSEIHSSYVYLAMSAYLAKNNWVGAAKWMRIQSQEEYGHAMRLFDFVLARNGQVELHPLDGPKHEFASVVDVFEAAYAHEKEVSRQIDALYELAGQQKAYAALVQLEWFINEQVEEEKTVREIVAQMNLVKDDPASLLDIDRELGARTAAAAGAAETP